MTLQFGKLNTTEFQTTTPKTTGLSFGRLGDKDPLSEPYMSREEALKYAMKSGSMDSVRGIKQMLGKLTGNEDLLEELKKLEEEKAKYTQYVEYKYDELSRFRADVKVIEKMKERDAKAYKQKIEKKMNEQIEEQVQNWRMILNKEVV